jgi:hypothetical protein
VLPSLKAIRRGKVIFSICIDGGVVAKEVKEINKTKKDTAAPAH